MRRRRSAGQRTAIFGIETSRDFLAKLEADFADWQKEPGSGRLALNCALTAYHMHEWVWGDWLKADQATKTALNIADLESFRTWLGCSCVWFAWIEGLANGTKHFVGPGAFQALRVSALSFAFDTADAGLDQGSWDGPMPFVVGEETFLLIDNGPDAGDHRWLPVGQLLDVVVRFWLEFFERYAPDTELGGLS